MTDESKRGQPAEAEGDDTRGHAVHLLQVLVHDAKNALSTVGANVAFVREALDQVDAEVDESLGDVVHATRRIRQTLDDISLLGVLQAAGAPRHPREPVAPAPGDRVPLRQAFEGAVRALQSLVAERKVSVTYEGPSAAAFFTDPLLLRRALELVLERALNGAPAGGTVVVRALEGAKGALVVESSAPLARPRSRGGSREASALAEDFRFDLVRRLFEAQGGRAELGERGARFTFSAG